MTTKREVVLKLLADNAAAGKSLTLPPEEALLVVELPPIPMRLTCPDCGTLHIDVGEFATKPHHTHACQSCGLCWRPAVVCTVGVQFLPGFKNGAETCA